VRVHARVHNIMYVEHSYVKDIVYLLAMAASNNTVPENEIAFT
jgi:hypothetical protein